MTAQQAVLSLGTFTLAGCGAGLIYIHDSTPLLKGLDWMGTALLAAGCATGLVLGGQHLPYLLPLSELAILVALMCCYRADRYLLGLESKLDLPTKSLFTCQVVVVALQWAGWIGLGTGIALASLLFAVQLAMTAHLLRRTASGKGRSSAHLTALLMMMLAGFALLRSGAAITGLLTDAQWGDVLNLVCYCVFVANAIGLAFFFFWRTTTRLSVELEHMASTDPLTRVFNRRVFLHWGESEQLRSRRNHAPFSVLMLDFDHFKSVNDTYGHHIGDRVLCAAVERIQDSIRGIDVLCRWGGEEFAVLLPNASEEATLIVAERVRRNVRLVSTDPHLAEVASGLQLSASIGTATYEGEEDSFEAMLQRADRALYEAKRTGRNRVIRSTRVRSETGSFPARSLALKTP